MPRLARSSADLVERVHAAAFSMPSVTMTTSTRWAGSAGGVLRAADLVDHQPHGVQQRRRRRAIVLSVSAVTAPMSMRPQQQVV